MLIRNRIYMFMLCSILMLTIDMLFACAKENNVRITPLSESKIIKHLPQEARVAQIPVLFDPDHTVKQRRKGIIVADVDNDKNEEIIVAYYTPPHEYIVNGKVQENFFKRARVKVLKWDGTQWFEQWDSGGWGFEFRARIGHGKREDEQIKLTNDFFDVRDYNGDGKLNIVFTRASFRAEGEQFEVWVWNGVTYERIVLK